MVANQPANARRIVTIVLASLLFASLLVPGGHASDTTATTTNAAPAIAAVYMYRVTRRAAAAPRALRRAESQASILLRAAIGRSTSASKPPTRTAIAGGALVLVLSTAIVAGGSSISLDIIVANAPPTAHAVFLYAAAPKALGGACAHEGRESSFPPLTGAARVVHVCVEGSDANGYADLCAAGSTFSVIAPDGEDMLGKRGEMGQLACATASGTRVALVGSFILEYWRTPTVSSSPPYAVLATLDDASGAASAPARASFGYGALRAIEAELATGSGLSDGKLRLHNRGNVPLTVWIIGDEAMPTGSAHTTQLFLPPHAPSAAPAVSVRVPAGAFTFEAR